MEKINSKAILKQKVNEWMTKSKAWTHQTNGKQMSNFWLLRIDADISFCKNSGLNQVLYLALASQSHRIPYI